MSDQISESNLSHVELVGLIAPGVLGFYTHFEVTEVFAQPKGKADVFNVFTILVAENRNNDEPQNCTFLNPKPIKLKSLEGWSFGVAQYTRPIAELAPAIELFGRDGTWKQSGNLLKFGNVVSIPRQFVPPDATAPIPWNYVLKNNFWNGSHVYEWCDREKNALKLLFEDSPRLQDLSAEIRKYVPIGIAALSDRLGNLVVQLPVTVLMSKFLQKKDSHDFYVQLAWHSSAMPRPLRATCEMESDGSIDSYTSTPIQEPETILPMRAGRGSHRGIIWDESNQVILAATGTSAFISSFSLNLNFAHPEPRTFTITQKDGTVTPYRIGLGSRSISSSIGRSDEINNGDWTQKRMYKEQADRLQEERRFVQYKPEPEGQKEKRENALSDLRYLINKHGQEGAWLWDPYLCAHDILETLFHCPHSGADLRALTSAREVPTGKVVSPVQKSPPLALFPRIWKRIVNARRSPPVELGFVERERAELNGTKSNWQGLRLEYRVKRGQAGWAFHDRFLIFPKSEMGALVWSLGTSVNSLGKEHHILQQVESGQLVKDAFVDLWDRLIEPEHLIWKKP